MKKKLIITLCTTALLLSGCQSSSAMLLEYSDMNRLKSSDVFDAVPADSVDAFTKNLAVISGDGSFGDRTDVNARKPGEEIIPETDTKETETSDVSETDITGESAGTTDETTDTTELSDADGETDASGETSIGETTGTETDTTTTDGADVIPEEEKLTDTPALLINKTTNEVIYYNDAFAEVPPASLTKLMTALLALKYGNLSDIVTLTPEMNSNLIPAAQTCGFVPGDKVSLETLLRCMIIYSGNETANAIAIHVAGSIPDFVAMMNEEAQKIGAVNTSFVNTNGLDVSGHYSSVYDLYLIFSECMKYDTFVNAMGTSNLSISYEGSDGKAKTGQFVNTNYYLKSMAESPEGLTVYGGKTGTTGAAGACLICYAVDDAGDEYVAVSLGNKDKPELYSQMNKILSKIQK